MGGRKVCWGLAGQWAGWCRERSARGLGREGLSGGRLFVTKKTYKIKYKPE